MAIGKYILIIIALLLVLSVGIYIWRKGTDMKYNYQRLSIEEWKQEEDLISIPHEEPKQENQEKINTKQPSNTPLDNPTFFNLVQKKRNKRKPYNFCTQKSEQH